MKNYYSKIYKAKIGNQNKQFDKFLQGKNIIKLNKKNKNDWEGLITEEEVKLVIKNMKNNKTLAWTVFP